MKITPFGRLVALVVGLVLLGFVGAAGAAATRPHDHEWRCVVVEPGDTLWDMASGSGGDVRAELHRIARENGLSSAAIQPGQALWIPAESETSAGSAGTEACRT